MPRKPPPITSFAPELLKLFEVAGKSPEPIEITGLHMQKAQRLIFRMHALRKAMRHYKHELLPLAESVQIKKYEDADGLWFVKIERADQDLIPQLHQLPELQNPLDIAEVKSSHPLVEIPGFSPTPSGEESIGVLNQFLKDQED